MAAQEAMSQAREPSQPSPLLTSVKLNCSFLGFHITELNYMILQVLSFDFVLLSELGSVVCYVVDLQSREHHFSKLCFPLSALLTIPEVILFIHCFNFLLNLLIWHSSLSITFSFFLLEYSEVFCKINLILKAVLDL